MQKLVKGVHGFQKKYFARNREMFERLAVSGQKPETLFITCADSRVVPNLITSTAPGELFIVRNVGNVVPSPSLPGGTAAALEYAVEILNVDQIIVCGHTHCGAIEAVLDPSRVEKLPLVRKWLDQTAPVRQIIDERYTHLDGDARLVAAVEENVLFQLENLRNFPFIAERLAAGKLLVNGWVFKIETGEVFDYDPEVGEFVHLVHRAESRSSIPPIAPPPATMRRP
jgi:carbonic anhydrase